MSFTTSEARATARLKICSECPEKGKTFHVDVCNQCGCVLKFKSKLSDAKCPLGKWEVIPSVKDFKLGNLKNLAVKNI